MYTVVDQLPNIFVTCADGFFGTPFIRFSVLHRISNFLSFIDFYVVEPCSAVSSYFCRYTELIFHVHLTVLEASAWLLLSISVCACFKCVHCDKTKFFKS